MAWLQKTLVVFFAVLFLATCKAPTSSYSSIPGLDKPHLIPVSVHYLTDEKDIRIKFERSLAKSNEVLMPHGIGLYLWSEDRMYRLPGSVTTIQHRQALGSRAIKDGTLHVFVVDVLSKEPGEFLHGLHSKRDTYNFIIITKSARLTTLAHEVGHALSLDHLEEVDNVMSPDRKDSRARFTAHQGKKMRRKHRQLLNYELH